MHIRTILSVILFFVIIMLHNASAQKIRLWGDDAAPGATGNRDADIPTLEIFKPNGSNANGAAILLVPGGAYGTVVMSEANAAKGYWVPKGFVLAVLRYRIAPYKYPVPMLDVKRAMRLLRTKTEELEVNDSRVGLMGCSAGGHLASYLATHYDMGDPEAVDSIDRMNCKPDFCIFVYPVITMDASFTHGGSRSNLLGNNPSSSLVDSLSNEKQVTKDTPPTFLVHGTVDNVVPWRNSQEFYDACVAHEIDTKFHKIESGCGGHGFGYSCENWGDDCYDWLKDGGYLDAVTDVVKFSGHTGMAPLPPIGVNDKYVIFDLSGTVVSPVRHLNFSHSQNKKCTGANGVFIVAKRRGGRCYTVGRSISLVRSTR